MPVISGDRMIDNWGIIYSPDEMDSEFGGLAIPFQFVQRFSQKKRTEVPDMPVSGDFDVSAVVHKKADVLEFDIILFEDLTAYSQAGERARKINWKVAQKLKDTSRFIYKEEQLKLLNNWNSEVKFLTI